MSFWPPLPLLAAGGPHDLPLISTIAGAFTAAWVLGLITQKLRLSPIVGYLLAGGVIGPLTPGLPAGVRVVAQEGAFGPRLLTGDVYDPPLMDGAGGVLDAAAFPPLRRPGFGVV